MATTNVTDADFDNVVLASTTPVLVDFWAVWCNPCKLVAPILDEISESHGDKIRIVKLNVDENPATAARFGVTSIPSSFVSPLDASNFSGIGQAFGAMFSVWSSGAGFLAVALAVFSIMLSDFFDTAGTIVGLGERGGMLDKKGQLPGSDKVLLVDSIAAGVGGLFGVSSNTTYIESAAGIEEGGRTGLTSVVTGLLFLAALIVAPIAGIIPAAATAPAPAILTTWRRD